MLKKSLLTKLFSAVVVFVFLIQSGGPLYAQDHLSPSSLFKLFEKYGKSSQETALLEFQLTKLHDILFKDKLKDAGEIRASYSRYQQKSSFFQLDWATWEKREGDVYTVDGYAEGTGRIIIAFYQNDNIPWTLLENLYGLNTKNNSDLLAAKRGFWIKITPERSTDRESNISWLSNNAPVLIGKSIVTLSMEGNIPEFELPDSNPLAKEAKNARDANTKGGLGAYFGDKLEGLADIGMRSYGFQPLYTNVKRGDILERVDYESLLRTAGRPDGLIEKVLDRNGNHLTVTVNIWDINNPADENSSIEVKLYKINRGGSIDFLLRSDIFDVLYNDNKIMRFSQEVVFGKAVYEFLKLLRNPALMPEDNLVGTPDILHLNEAHTVVAAAQIRADDSFKKTAIAYTNHTIVPAGLERHNAVYLNTDVDRMMYQIGLPAHNHGLFRSEFVFGDIVDFCKAAASLADIINGVSEEHATVTQKLFNNLCGNDFTKQVIGVLNGSGQTWKFDELISAESESTGKLFAEGLYNIHERSKQIAYEEIEKRTGRKLNKNEPTVWLVRRLTDYKSQYPMLRWLVDIMCADRDVIFTRDTLLAAWHDTIPDMFKTETFRWEIKAQLDQLFPDKNACYHGLAMQIVVGGPEYEPYWVQEFKRWHNMDKFKGRFVYAPKSDTSLLKAQSIGSDLLLDSPRPFDEACGTSHQRSMLNGGIVIGNLTGGVRELITEENGFPFGPFKISEEFYQNAPRQILNAMIKASSMFYDNRKAWQKKMFTSYRDANIKVTAQKMEERYAENVYKRAIYRRTLSILSEYKNNPENYSTNNWRGPFTLKNIFANKNKAMMFSELLDLAQNTPETAQGILYILGDTDAVPEREIIALVNLLLLNLFGELEPVNEFHLEIVDAHIFCHMTPNRIKQLLTILNGLDRGVVLILFNEEDSWIRNLAKKMGILVIEHIPDNYSPEYFAENEFRRRSDFPPDKMISPNVLTSLTNIDKWRPILGSMIKYIICRGSNITTSGILQIYDRLPQEIRSDLGIRRDTIEGYKVIQERKFNLELLEHEMEGQPLIEISV